MMAGYDIIVIGGSAGSLPVILAILEGISDGGGIPVVVVLHRQKNVSSEMGRIFESRIQGFKVVEPEDKETILPDHVYLAPQNYHLLVEQNHSFSLDYSEPVHYSRPSIDVTFESMSRVYGERMLAIVLSGANSDGARGVEFITGNKGTVLVQDPASAEYPAMPSAAISRSKMAKVLSPEDIINFLKEVIKK